MLKIYVLFIIVTWANLAQANGGHKEDQSLSMAHDYVELVCADREKLSVIYMGEDIDSVMKEKSEEIAFWKGVVQKINSPTGDEDLFAASKACSAYAQILNVVQQYTAMNSCTDGNGNLFLFSQVTEACTQLALQEISSK